MPSKVAHCLNTMRFVDWETGSLLSNSIHWLALNTGGIVIQHCLVANIYYLVLQKFLFFLVLMSCSFWIARNQWAVLSACFFLFRFCFGCVLLCILACYFTFPHFETWECLLGCLLQCWVRERVESVQRHVCCKPKKKEQGDSFQWLCGNLHFSDAVLC